VRQSPAAAFLEAEEAMRIALKLPNLLVKVPEMLLVGDPLASADLSEEMVKFRHGSCIVRVVEPVLGFHLAARANRVAHLAPDALRDEVIVDFAMDCHASLSLAKPLGKLVANRRK
jgi:hypothetical protein